MKAILTIIVVLLSSLTYGQSLTDKLIISYKESFDSTLSFRGIFAIDKNSAWISGNKGAVYRTDNGGKLWQKIEVTDLPNSDFRDIQILAENSILLMRVGSGDNSRIYKTIDNGRTWKVTFENKHPQGFLNSIAFWDKMKGIAIGDPVNDHIYIITTKDGGDSWQEIDYENIPRSLKGEAGFAASGTCISVLGETLAWFGSGGPKARIFKSNDLGHSWSVYETPVLSGNNSSGIFSVFFRNKNEGIILGGDYTKVDDTNRTIALTKNSGKSWKLLENTQIPFQSCAGEVMLADKSIFITTGPAGTYLSTDGSSWELCSKEGFHCLSVSKKDNTIWFAGSNGRIAKIEIDKKKSL